ncbi:PAF acetylhydrolase [Cadophora sp. MPI-SDFR-AT-0126]|nr:PAF acetylhydrolase [Leotiomycetes sp. MPI-SDFR-AT-0126]
MQALFIKLLLLVTTTVGYLVPNPGGEYNVTVTIGPLTDYTRNDRELMLSVFQPAKCSSTVSIPYMPNMTANFQGPFFQQVFDVPVNISPLLLEAQLPVCPGYPSNCSLSNEDSPILLFSPGYSIPRTYYNYLASAISSEGFIVITIDHPGDANIITYPDGHTIINNDTVQNLDTIRKQIPVVAADVSFIIDQLSNATAVAELLPHRGHRAFSTDHVAMLGHSLGGIAAVTAAGQDCRLRGAINWDGTFLALPAELSQPVLLMSHGHADYSWPEAWPLLKGPKLWVDIANTTHLTFSDGPTLFEASGQDPAAFGDLLGTIPPTRMVQILVEYSTAWMNGVFAGKIGGALLDGQEPGRFPEASVVLKDNY